MAKMINGELVSMKVLEKVCEKLGCDFGDIVHYERKPKGSCVHEQVAKADCLGEKHLSGENRYRAYEVLNGRNDC